MSGLGDHEIAASSTVSAEARERSEALKDEGNALFKKKQFLQAAEAYTQAIKLCGDNKAVWSNRSATFLELGRIEDAIRDAEICRRLEPTWPKGCYRLAVARLAAGLYEDAAIAAFEGCKIDGNNKELQKVMRDAVAKGKMEHQQKQQQSQQQLRQANARII
jgi:stress-induced-phosphoprotein 1